MFKTGIESFDYDFRENVLNKNAKFTDVKEVSDYFDSACLMVGIKGQTKEMIEKTSRLAFRISNGLLLIFSSIIPRRSKEMMSL